VSRVRTLNLVSYIYNFLLIGDDPVLDLLNTIPGSRQQ